ncbi:MAG: hypothetical protein ABH825_04730 [Candidatus Omnitrophota bacterium]
MRNKLRFISVCVMAAALLSVDLAAACRAALRPLAMVEHGGMPLLDEKPRRLIYAILKAHDGDLREAVRLILVDTPAPVLICATVEKYLELDEMALGSAVTQIGRALVDAGKYDLVSEYCQRDRKPSPSVMDILRADQTLKTLSAIVVFQKGPVVSTAAAVEKPAQTSIFPDEPFDEKEARFLHAWLEASRGGQENIDAAMRILDNTGYGYKVDPLFAGQVLEARKNRRLSKKAFDVLRSARWRRNPVDEYFGSKSDPDSSSCVADRVKAKVFDEKADVLKLIAEGKTEEARRAAAPAGLDAASSSSEIQTAI